MTNDQTAGRPTISTRFTGIGGVDEGAKQAGYDSLWGIEIDPKLAKFCSLNHPGIDMKIWDVCNTNFSLLETPTWLHNARPRSVTILPQ